MFLHKAILLDLQYELGLALLLACGGCLQLLKLFYQNRPILLWLLPRELRMSYLFVSIACNRRLLSM